MTLAAVDDIRTLIRLAPLLGFARRLSAATDTKQRNAVVGEAMKWLAAQSKSKLDDEFVGHVSAILNTAEGAALVRWCISRAAELETPR